MSNIYPDPQIPIRPSDVNPAAQSYPFEPLQPAPERERERVGNGDRAHSGQLAEGQKSRLRKACDACRVRKVKCDESGPPCRACAALDVPCTFLQQSKRRGPPNRKAEEFKRQRVGSPSNVAATLASLSHAVLNAESICPFPILELLVDDFFTYIHPLVPFPHEPSFRAAFMHREDLNNPSFLALLASMVSTLVASFPRKPRQHLKAHGKEKLFPNWVTLVERCHKVAVEARGPGYLDKDLTVYDAATSYFLGLAGGYTLNWKQARLYFAESMTIVRVLGADKSRPDKSPQDPSYEPIDYIRQEIGRRIFWVLFVGIRSMQQIGDTESDIVLAPPTASSPYPPLPLEVDDQYLYVDHVDLQPSNVISQLVGFNLGIQIYMTCDPIANMELVHGIDEIFDLSHQMRILESSLHAVKRTMSFAPKELHLNQYPSEPVQDRRQVQYEIQKANLYASQLGTRSWIVEKHWNLLEAHQRMNNTTGSTNPAFENQYAEGRVTGNSEAYDMVETQTGDERENIVKDILGVLGSISQVNMEPNGASFINKIRQIASTLLDTPRNRKGPLALRAEEYLGWFIDVLMKLERVTPPSSNEGWTCDEEQELSNWADLREFQVRFAKQGGFFS